MVGGDYRKTANMALLEEFRNSDMTCAKVEEFTQKDAYSCANSLKNTIKICKMNSIDAIARNGEVFLIKKNM